ncbi:hypothetical protein KY358_05980 [Candidatus Woesearchaeota archaeon]|nr:hypothetical protein [Candidatus Woesearchaeota archaeon]
MINELRQLGLNEYEAKVYLTLLENGALKGGIISKRSGVPHGKTYQSLTSLEEKGFVSITPLKPKIFTALDPKIAIQNILSTKTEQFNNIQNIISDKLKSQKILADDDFHETIQVFAGKDKMWNLSHYLYGNAKKIMRHMFTYEIRNFSQDRAMLDAIKRGVEVRVIAAKKTKQGLTWMKQDIKNGIKVRYFPVDEIRLEISDEKQSMLDFINPRDSRDRMILFFNHGFFSKMLTNFFDEIWKKAEIIK